MRGNPTFCPKIKLCGLRFPQDIAAANSLLPDYVGFVFAPGRRRTVTAEAAAALGAGLHPSITPVGVFVNEAPDTVAALLQKGVIDVAQLHGDEGEDEIVYLQKKCSKPLIRAFVIRNEEDLRAAEACPADLLLDSGTGSGECFDWTLLRDFRRPYFLAGGLTPETVKDAILTLHPYGVDVSSGIETDGRKDSSKMNAFVTAVREAQKNGR